MLPPDLTGLSPARIRFIPSSGSASPRFSSARISSIRARSARSWSILAACATSDFVVLGRHDRQTLSGRRQDYLDTGHLNTSSSPVSRSPRTNIEYRDRCRVLDEKNAPVADSQPLAMVANQRFDLRRQAFGPHCVLLQLLNNARCCWPRHFLQRLPRRLLDDDSFHHRPRLFTVSCFRLYVTKCDYCQPENGCCGNSMKVRYARAPTGVPPSPGFPL